MSSKIENSWPPRKSWTRVEPLDGFFYFVAINYGGCGKEKWINFISVLDGGTGLKVQWEEIKIGKLWVPGWIKLNKKQTRGSSQNKLIDMKRLEISKDQDWCLHPSDDSTLLIPTKRSHNREW